MARLMLLVTSLARSASNGCFNFLELSEEGLWSQQYTHGIFLQVSKALLMSITLSMPGTCPRLALD